MDNSVPTKPKLYLTSRQVRTRYGGRSHMWIVRRLQTDPRFPRPLMIGNRQHFDEAALDAYDRQCVVGRQPHDSAAA